MTRRTALTIALTAGIPLLLRAGQSDPAAKTLRSCRQLLAVETAEWKATSGSLTLWVRDKSNGPWRQDGTAVPVMVGKGGMRWGRGLHAAPPGGILKHEGDMCSPAGIFGLDTAFGSITAKQARVTRWPWQQMTPTHAGVDDSLSRYYNRIVDSTRVRKDWKSAEDMVPKSGAYRCGVVVKHNWDRQPGGGSCIFLHISTLRPTAGCTSMAEAGLLRILRWLDPSKNPLLVQLPKREWQNLSPEWGLPVQTKGSARTATKKATEQR